MKTVDFIVGREVQILEHYGFEITGNRHIDCPICEKKKGFRINMYEGRPAWICTCGSGDLISLLIETSGRAFKDVAREIDDRFGNTDSPAAPVQPKKFSSGKTEPMTGTQVVDYLKSRGIEVVPRHFVRYGIGHYYDSGASHDCMFAMATDHAMRDSYIHRTFLQSGEKIPGKSKKLETVNQAQNVSIKMFDVAPHLGISEGIESALSAAQIFKVPVWSVMSTAFMGKFRAPAGVKVLTIYADNDSHGAGLASAFECGNKNLMSRNDVSRVIVKWPEAGDFNDHLLEPKKVFEWQLSR